MKLPKYDTDPVIWTPPPSPYPRRETNRTLICICVEMMAVLVILLLVLLFRNAAPGSTGADSQPHSRESTRPRALRPVMDRCAFECQRDCAPPEACTIMKESYE